MNPLLEYLALMIEPVGPWLLISATILVVVIAIDIDSRRR